MFEIRFLVQGIEFIVKFGYMTMVDLVNGIDDGQDVLVVFVPAGLFP